MATLEFHRAIVEELTEVEEGEGTSITTPASAQALRNPSSLVVLGEGLGLSYVIAELLRIHLEEAGRAERHGGESRHRLVILIGFSEYQRKAIVAVLARDRRKREESLRQVGSDGADREAHSGSRESVVGDIDSSVGSAERSRLYALGGCLFVTTRILTVDFLQGRLSPLRVSGLYVGGAHRLKDDSGEAFCVRMYRGTGHHGNPEGDEGAGKGNKFGFVHAFTDEPTAFAGTFKVEHVMKALHVRKVFLWPRFETRVQESLQPDTAPPEPVDVEELGLVDSDSDDGKVEEEKGSKLSMPEVVELSIPVTRSMEIIQSALASAMESCLKELGQHKFLGLEFDLTVSNNLFRDFGRSIQRQLDKRWHLVSRKTKQITRDLSTLRRLAFCVLRYDSPTFLQYLEMLRATESVNSIWLFLDDAHVIFDEAKKRVYKFVRDDSGGEKKKKGKGGAPQATGSQHKVVPVLEQPSKWEHLKQVLEEIQQDRSKMLQGIDDVRDRGDDGGGSSMYPILVLTQENLVATQLQHFVLMGGEAIMNDAFNLYLAWRNLSTKGNQAKGSKNPRDKGKGKNSDYSLRMTGAAGVSMRHEDQALQNAAPVEKKRKRAAKGKVIDLEEEEDPRGTPWLMEGVHFYALEGRELELELHRIKPSFVVLYDQSPSAIRQLEVYSATTLHEMRASNCETEGHSRLLRIYMLFYAESLEQQKFCTAVDRERKVFKSLIEQKAVMMAPIAEDGTAVVEKPTSSLRDPLGATTPLLPFGAGSSSNNAVTRQAGGLLAKAKKKAGSIVVDMREFMSNLPGVLHAYGFQISPCTLEVGDYILSPEICVERKAIPDLIQSFGSGRLFQQAKAMAKHYRYPVLLIEFSGDKAFALQGPDDWSSGSDISQRALGSKLSLLAIHVPKLRIIWSRSTQATADIFAQLKSNQEEPRFEDAQQIGIPEDPHLRSNNNVNQAALDVLQKLPGVTQTNWRQLASKAKTLSRIAAMSEEELRKVMNSSKGAKALFNLLNTACVGVPSL
ncbi:DNA repair endonuclease XPF [Chloropicon primus]|nr:DNA repair endonuclease XPF [Chloropicon primus]